MKYTNNLGLPEPIVQAVANDSYQMDDADISTTTLINPPQIRLLLSQHGDELEEDVSTRIWSLMGQAMHAVLERIPGGIKEQRFQASIGGKKISGQIDYYESEVLWDWKQTSVWSVLDGPKREWIEQANINRWLMFRNGYRVKELKIGAILRDWQRNKIGDKTYPKNNVVVYDLPVWPIPDTENFILHRLHLHYKEQPKCSDDDRWKKPDVFAVNKNGRKHALRLKPSYEEAITWAEENGYAKDGALNNGISIDSRKGEAVRCLNYCPVAEVCSQWKEEASIRQIY